MELNIWCSAFILIDRLWDVLRRIGNTYNGGIALTNFKSSHITVKHAYVNNISFFTIYSFKNVIDITTESFYNFYRIITFVPYSFLFIIIFYLFYFDYCCLNYSLLVWRDLYTPTPFVRRNSLVVIL